MSLLSALLIGVIIGAIGGYLIQENFDTIVLDVCMGIVGAIIGDAIYYFATRDEYFLFTVGGALSQAAGALLFVLIFSLIQKSTTKKDGSIDQIGQ